MKFYKLNNTWVSWDELHNGYGYTTEPSIAVTYKSAHNGSSWGEDAGSGYYVGDIDDMVHGSFWCDSDYGWFDLNGLVWNPEIYPSNATPLMMQNGSLTSPAVSLESDGVTYYLIKAIVADTGWITADEAAELGWEVYDEMQGTFIVFDTVENKIVSAFTNELTYGEIEGIILQSPRLVYGVDISVPTAQFWFTQNGRNETENRALNTGNPLYTEDGVRLLPSTHSDYIGAIPLSFMEVDGDMFMADSDPENNYVRLVNDSLNLYIKPGIPIRDESAWAVQFERVFTLSFANTQLPDITITMPADETGYKGTSITLPTMSGEYESGGKTWKPSAWDIGAFGSSYTLNADTVAHLLFEEVQLYPTVSLNGDFGVDNWVYPNTAQTAAAIYAGATRELYDQDGNTHALDFTKSYAVVQWQVTAGTRAGVTQFEIVDVSGNIGVQNRTPNTISLLQVRLAVCSSDQVITVHVYDKSTGVVYNAFKYTDAGTDYYYILDGVQSNWSDDIDSLGFAPGEGFIEITLYLASGNKNAQGQVTSSYSGNVDSSYCYPLYSDQSLTNQWNGYDYSNDYVLGYYSSGNWRARNVQNVADMPASTVGSSAYVAYILLDTGRLWIVSNYSSVSGTTSSITSIIVRIYPKGQQNYPAYVYGASNAYSNVSISAGSSKSCVRYASTSIYIQMPTQFPPIFLMKVRGAATNEYSLSEFSILQPSSSTTEFKIKNTTDAEISIRNAVYSLPFPTFYVWVNLTGNTSTSSGTAYPLIDSYGNYVEIDSNFVYYAIALVKYDGTNAVSAINYLRASTLGSLNSTHPERLYFKQTYGTVSLSAVWCYRKPSATVSKIGDEYTCSSSLARRITVYDVNDVEYGAFWLHLNVDWYYVDYYYVLDDVQTDWTNNLESIGYSLEPQP